MYSPIVYKHQSAGIGGNLSYFQQLQNIILCVYSYLNVNRIIIIQDETFRQKVWHSLFTLPFCSIQLLFRSILQDIVSSFLSSVSFSLFYNPNQRSSKISMPIVATPTPNRGWLNKNTKNNRAYIFNSFQRVLWFDY